MERWRRYWRLVFVFVHSSFGQREEHHPAVWEQLRLCWRRWYWGTETVFQQLWRGQHGQVCVLFSNNHNIITLFDLKSINTTCKCFVCSYMSMFVNCICLLSSSVRLSRCVWLAASLWKAQGEGPSARRRAGGGVCSSFPVVTWTWRTVRRGRGRTEAVTSQRLVLSLQQLGTVHTHS